MEGLSRPEDFNLGSNLTVERAIAQFKAMLQANAVDSNACGNWSPVAFADGQPTCAEEYDGAEEFVLDEGADDAHTGKTEILSLQTPTSSATSDAGAADESSSESSDEESELYQEPESLAASTAISEHTVGPVVRRSSLPSPPVGDEGSLFAVLKKNVGKVRALKLTTLILDSHPII